MIEKRILGLLKQIDDNTAVLLTDSANMYYYSGFTGEGCVILTKTKKFILTDFRYTEQATKESSGFIILTKLSKMADNIKTMGILNMLFEDDTILYYDYKRYKNAFKGVKFTPHLGKISCSRQIKSQFEINKISKAASIADLAFEHIINYIKAGVTEIEIAAELEYFIKKRGATAMSFDTIIASGYRSAMPHAAASNKTINSGDFVVLDFGCVFDGYCSDMTRTIIVGSATDEQKRVYNTVKKAQELALKAIKENALCKDIDKTARDYIKTSGYGDNFGHGLGHSVGLKVHEQPSLSPKSEYKLLENMVVTVEPGIYIEGFGGVRIEDLVVITQNNCNILSKTPKDLMIL